MYSRPRVKLIKSPWEAALETGSVAGAFQEFAPAKILTPDPYKMMAEPLPSWHSPNTIGYAKLPEEPKAFTANPSYNSPSINKIVDNLQKGGATNVNVYKPKLPQAWNSATQQTQMSKFEVYFNLIQVTHTLEYNVNR